METFGLLRGPSEEQNILYSHLSRERAAPTIEVSMSTLLKTDIPASRRTVNQSVRPAAKFNVSLHTYTSFPKNPQFKSF